MKRYCIEFETDKPNGYRYDFKTDSYIKTNIRTAGYASTLSSAKSVIRNMKKNPEYENPRNFKVYDTFADVEEETNYIPCVYEEQ